MRSWKIWLAVGLTLVVGGGIGLWFYDLRYRPHSLTKHQGEIVRLLESSGYVSPGLQGPKLYMISFRTCPDCIRYKTEEFPKLQAAQVDTRVIMIARRDFNGLAKSTPQERTTVAELWLTRKWSLLEQWMVTPPAAWKAEGLVPADGDLARTSVVEAGRSLADRLGPLLAANGFGFDKIHYPTLIWWTKSGQLRGCACEKPQTYAHVRRELGIKD